jgi:hypothetical protein
MCIIFAAAHVDDSTGTWIINKLFVDFGGHWKKIAICEQTVPFSLPIFFYSSI